jgi:hypothetical protein
MCPWKVFGVWVGIGLLVLYCFMIFLDLPSPAGTTYRQDLPASELAYWDAKPVPGAVPAPHWWNKAQGLRGWSVFPEGWSWPKLGLAPLTHWLALLGLVIVGSAGLWLLQRWPRHGWWPTALKLAALVLFAYALQLGTLWLKGSSPLQLLLDRVLDPDFSGYLTSALRVDRLAAYFSEYDHTLGSADWCSHCKSHMPGPVLFYWLDLRLVRLLPVNWQGVIAQKLLVVGHIRPPDLASDGIIVAVLGGHALLLMGAAITIPLYFLARFLAGGDVALPLAGLGAVVPAAELMSPEFDQFYGTLAALALYAGLRGLGAPRSAGQWGLCAGLLVAFGLFWTLFLGIVIGALILLLLPAVAGVMGPASGNTRTTMLPLPAWSTLRWLLGLGLGAGVPWLLLWAVGHMHLVSILESLLTAQLHGITRMRPYVPWIAFNLVDFLQFLGLPLVATILFTMGRRSDGASPVAQRWAATGAAGWIGWGPVHRLALLATSANIFAVLFWGILLGLDVTGTVRAEVSRLWIPLAPLALLAVFHAAGRNQLSSRQIYGILVAQLAICLVIGGNWLTP